MAIIPAKASVSQKSLVRGDPLAQKQRAQRQQHEGLRVVDRRRDRDRRMSIGAEQQQPVEHDGNAAEHRDRK
jgi:hypothetical protein